MQNLARWKGNHFPLPKKSQNAKFSNFKGEGLSVAQWLGFLGGLGLLGGDGDTFWRDHLSI